MLNKPLISVSLNKHDLKPLDPSVFTAIANTVHLRFGGRRADTYLDQSENFSRRKILNKALF